MTSISQSHFDMNTALPDTRIIGRATDRDDELPLSVRAPTVLEEHTAAVTCLKKYVLVSLSFHLVVQVPHCVSMSLSSCLADCFVSHLIVYLHCMRISYDMTCLDITQLPIRTTSVLPYSHSALPVCHNQLLPII